MSHIVADRVKDTTTTTGTGTVTLSGTAPTGFRTFGSVMADGETTFYCISHQAANEWEIGIGTYTASGTTLARTTVIASSNSNAAVSFSAGTKDVFITSPAITQSWGVLVTTPSADQDDYAPTGLQFCNRLGINPSASIAISGLTGGYEGREITISNRSTDYLVILENQSTSSTAANRFDLPNGFPFFLMPGDRITLTYSGNSSRWQAQSASSNLAIMGLTEFSDFVSSTLGPFTSTVSGTGASAQASTYLVGTTERPLGVTQIDSGTTATGRATLGNAGTGDLVPTLGAALSVSRLAAEAANSGTETWQLISGFADSAAGTFTDGVAWNLRWNGTTAEWSQDRLSNSTATRTASGSPTPDTNYIWLAVFVNPGWTRADYWYSTDSITWTKAGSPTTGFPGNTRFTSWVAASLIKSAGTTQRNASIDLAGYRVDYVRG